MRDLEFKSFEIETKKTDTAGNLIISGHGAIFNNIDSGNEIIESPAFDKTLKERKGRIAFCYQHDIWNPIAKITKLETDAKGLYFEAVISAADMDIQTKIKEGILKELSIGYVVVSSRHETKNGVDVRILEELDLFEISLVTIAMNPLAMVEGMKSEEKRDFLNKEFDRLLAIVRNEKINFEIRKLKSLVLSGLETQGNQHESEPIMKASEMLNLLITNKD